MTNKDVINQLLYKPCASNCEFGHSAGKCKCLCKFKDAVNVAIKALEAQQNIVHCKDCAKCGFCGNDTNLEIMGFNGFCSRGKLKEESYKEGE